MRKLILAGMAVAMLAVPAVSMATASVASADVARYQTTSTITLDTLYNGVHFPLDVIAGALLGVATALLLLAGARRGSLRAPQRD